MLEYPYATNEWIHFGIRSSSLPSDYKIIVVDSLLIYKIDGDNHWSFCYYYIRMSSESNIDMGYTLLLTSDVQHSILITTETTFSW